MISFRSSPSLVSGWELRSGAAGLFLVTLAVGLFSGAPAWGQKKDYEEWREQQRQKYEKYLNEQDKAFLKFLKKQWRDVDVEAQRGSPIDDKPGEIPTVDELGNDPTSAAPSDAQQAPSPSEEPSQQLDTQSAEPDVEEDAQPEPPPPEDPQAPDPAPTEEDPDPPPAEQFENQRPQERGGDAAPATMTLQFFGAATSVPYSGTLAPTREGIDSHLLAIDGRTRLRIHPRGRPAAAHRSRPQ
jgi:hypothetical protein